MQYWTMQDPFCEKPSSSLDRKIQFAVAFDEALKKPE